MVSAIIVAGGKGLRMGESVKKQYLSLSGMPVLSRTVIPFETSPLIDRIILVVPYEDVEFCIDNIIRPFNFKTEIQVIAGGSERQESVYNGLKKAHGASTVLIHDGVRPFINEAQIECCITRSRKKGACILAIPAYDTLKSVDENNTILNTVDRSNIWMAQTPQAFDYNLIMSCHERAIKENFQGTDDASIVEYSGKTVTVVPGSRLNIKITTKEDLVLAEMILSLSTY